MKNQLNLVHLSLLAIFCTCINIVFIIIHISLYLIILTLVAITTAIIYSHCDDLEEYIVPFHKFYLPTNIPALIIYILHINLDIVNLISLIENK